MGLLPGGLDEGALPVLHMDVGGLPRPSDDECQRLQVRAQGLLHHPALLAVPVPCRDLARRLVTPSADHAAAAHRPLLGGWLAAAVPLLPGCPTLSAVDESPAPPLVDELQELFPEAVSLIEWAETLREWGAAPEQVGAPPPWPGTPAALSWMPVGMNVTLKRLRGEPGVVARAAKLPARL